MTTAAEVPAAPYITIEGYATITISGKTYPVSGVHHYPAHPGNDKISGWAEHTTVYYFTGQRRMTRRLKPTDRLA